MVQTEDTRWVVMGKFGGARRPDRQRELGDYSKSGSHRKTHGSGNRSPAVTRTLPDPATSDLFRMERKTESDAPGRRQGRGPRYRRRYSNPAGQRRAKR